MCDIRGHGRDEEDNEKNEMKYHDITVNEAEIQDLCASLVLRDFISYLFISFYYFSLFLFKFFFPTLRYIILYSPVFYVEILLNVGLK